MKNYSTTPSAPFNPYRNFKLNTSYTIFTKQGDPRLNMLFPNNIYEDLKKLATFNCRTVKEEILARIVKTLELNNELMATERFMRLLLKKELAHQPSKRNKKTL